MTKKRITIWLIISLFLIGFVSYATIGVRDYLSWLDTKAATAASSFPWQCGAYQILTVQPACNPGTLGKCTCASCDPLCNGSTYVTFAGQEVCGGINFACVGPEILAQMKGSGLVPGSQAILAGTSNMLTGNAVVATPSLAASRTEKLIDFIDKYFIASFED